MTITTTKEALTMPENPEQIELLAADHPAYQPPPEIPAAVPPGYDTGKCRSCGTLVIWTTMVNAMGEIKRRPDGTKVRNPVDLRPNRDGTLRLIGRGRAQSIGKGELVLPDQRYQSHFATCEFASRHKRGGGRRG